MPRPSWTGVSAKERGVYSERFDKCVWDQSAFQEGFFNIMPKDWFSPCHCELCHERHQQPDKGGNIVWELGVEVARRLQKENIPWLHHHDVLRSLYCTSAD